MTNLHNFSFRSRVRPPAIDFHSFFAILMAGMLLCAPVMAADPVGSVNTATGDCRITTGGDTLAAEIEQPVILNDELSTGKGARLGVVFLDETTLTLDESSHASIDEYVYNDEGSDLLFKFTKGTFRTITGGIVQHNPEGFNMETPLANIGIRGSDVYVIIQPEGEEAGALHLGENHALEVRTEKQTVRITESGMRVRISPEGLIFTPTRIPPSMFNSMLNLGSAAPSGSQPGSSGKSAAPGIKKSAGKTMPKMKKNTSKSNTFTSPKGRTSTPTKMQTPTKTPAPSTPTVPTRTTSPTTSFKLPVTTSTTTKGARVPTRTFP